MTRIAPAAARSALALGFALVLVACGGTSVARPNALPKAEVHGTVTAGPTCPVERVGRPCPPRPVIVTVRATDGTRVVASTRSAADGTYRLDLPVGSYTISAEGATPFPRCNATQLSVAAADAVELNLSCDTGIR